LTKLSDKFKELDKEQKTKKKPEVKETLTHKKPTETTKLVIPDFIDNLFDNIDKSITSMWGMQKDGKIKWDSKFNQWESFKMWFKKEVNK